MATKQDGLIDEAEKAIARILAKLESDTGSVMESIAVNEIDVTHLGSNRQEVTRQVRIELRRQPGTRWGQVG